MRTIRSLLQTVRLSWQAPPATALRQQATIPGAGNTRATLRNQARQCRRRYSSNLSPSPKDPTSSAPPMKPSSSSSSSSAPKPSRAAISRILSRLPCRLQPYASRLRDAPLSHVAAFLILHELTALLPLAGLFALFHYCGDAVGATRLVGWVSDRWGADVRDGLARYARYFRRKGWIGAAAGEEGEQQPGQGAVTVGGSDGNAHDMAMDWWSGEDRRYRAVVELAVAYAITKALFPVRIVASVWATPWFARVLGRLRRVIPRA